MSRDGELLSRYARGGDEAAFAEVVRRHGDMVLAACRRVVRAAGAEDAAQATFMLLARKAESLSDREGVAGWLLTSARYVAQAHLRSETRRARREREVVAMQEERRADSKLVGKLRGYLDAALESLPSRHREAVVLYYLEGQSRAEVGAALGLSPEGVSMRLRRGLEGLRSRLAHVAGCGVPQGALIALLAGERVAGAGGAAALLSAIKSAGGVAGLSAGAGEAGLLVKGAVATSWAKAKLAVAAICAVTAAAGVATTAGRHFLAPEALAATPGAITVIGEDSQLRYHVTKRRTKNITPKYLRKYDRRHYSMIDKDPQREPAPAGWTGADFDDSSWPRERREWLERSIRHHTSIVCVRGKFEVTDPSAVKGLHLAIGYRGGAAVFLNGKEVKRFHLPEGKLALETEAEPYPEDIWTGKGGKPVASLRRMKDKSELEKIARQVRGGSCALPVSALRKGVNVVAVEIRRSPYSSKVQTPWFKQIKGRGRHYYTVWKTVGLEALTLTADGGGITPNAPRPAGIQVWTPDVNDRLCALDYGGTTERPLVKIVGARGGGFCGQIALGSAREITGLKVVPGALESGAGAIDGKNVKVLFGACDKESGGVPYFDGLLPTAPKKVPLLERKVRVPKKKGPPEYRSVPAGATQLVFLRVEVPADAKAGTYRGEVSVSADGLAAAKVPVELSVADWTLPKPRAFRTYISIYQSPTSLALKYKVDTWGDEHWKLIDRSWRLLGRLGNRTCLVHAIEKTQFGNHRAMITFIEKPGGKYDYDLSIMEKYVDLAAKHCKLEVVGLQLLISQGMQARAADQENTVTVKGADGKLKGVQIPPMGTEASKKFWKPLLDAVYASLKKRGLEKSLVLGSFSDDKGLAVSNKAFDEIFPGGSPAPWMRGGHIPAEGTKPYPAAGGGGRIVLHEHCYGMSPVTPLVKFPPIWDYRARKNPGVAFFRDSSVKIMPPLGLRVETLRGLACGKKGMGRIGLDWFRVLKGKGGAVLDVYNRWPRSYVAARRPYQSRLAAEGPDGAITSIRLEAFLEGIQECEALMVVSEAAEKHEARIGPELTARCRAVIAECLWRTERAWEYCNYDITQTDSTVHFHGNHHGWQKTTAKLYATVAEVSKRLGN